MIEKKYHELSSNKDFKSHIFKKEKLSKGYISLNLSKNERDLIVGTINSTILHFKTDRLKIEEPNKYSGFISNFYVRSKISPCSKYILSGSADHSVYIWKVIFSFFKKLNFL